jgi:methyl-accepting chemotaxis protein
MAKFRRNAPAVLIAAVIVIIAALSALSYGLFSSLTRSVETSQFELMQSILDTALLDAQNKALARAELIAELPTTRRLMAAKDRAGLLAEFGPMFEGQKARHGVDQAQFHLPPATSLLRLNDPTKYGDDLTKFRPMVVAVNRDHASRKGFAIARSGPAIFGVAPITDLSDNPVGSFEIGIDFAPLLVSLKAAHGFDLALFVEGDSLRQFATGVDPAKLSDQNQVGRFIRFSATNADLIQSLAGASDIAVVNEPTHYTRDALGVPYGVLLVPLQDNAGQSLGVIAVARDFSGTRAASGQSLVWQVCFGFIAIVLLVGAVIVVIHGLLLKPLRAVDARFAALANGTTPDSIADPEAYPEELHHILDLYERIRSHRIRSETQQ